ncbi:MAG: hypothetical protein HYV09_31020 [Deltaproteobacteria bacterium]|nr:hypothetical protein [Deltaproteobacteria bacterium]
MSTPDGAVVVAAGEPESTRDARPALGAAPDGGIRALLTLDSAHATVAYWAGVVLVAAAMFVPRLIPCVDYPQHLALADIARRLADPGAPEQVTHQLNYFTYNGLFHVLVARLARVMPIELAGRTVVAFSLVLLGGSVLALLRTLRRPAHYAALATPVLFSFALGWGFVNYALGTAIAFTALVSVARTLRRPTVPAMLTTAVLGLLCAMTHVLAMLLLCLFAASLAPEVAWRSVRGAGLRRVARGIWRSTIALAPILVGAWWCIAVYREQYKWDPVMYKDATLEGTAPPISQKLMYFGSWASGVHSDMTDQALTLFAVAVCIVASALGALRLLRREHWDGEGDSHPVVLPVIAMMTAYLMTPMVFIGTHLIFPRLTQAVIIAAILAAPRIVGVSGQRVRVAALAVGAVAGVNLLAHSAAYAYETNDASRVIDDLPPGRRVTAVVSGAGTFSFRHGTLVHLAAYYAARKGGDWSFSFARYLSVPVRFKVGGAPWWPVKGWEFTPTDYNPRCKYARHFDVVLVKAPLGLDAEQDVRRVVFGPDAQRVKLVSHHGAYWGFDTAGLPDDGTY